MLDPMSLSFSRLRHTASRSIGWTLFFAVLLSPLGGYLYVGRLRRAAGFFGLFALVMAAVGAAIETWHWPLFLADSTVAVMAIAAFLDLAGLILAARRTLRTQGESLPVFRS